MPARRGVDIVSRSTGGLIAKLLALAFVNAVAVWGIQQMVAEEKLAWAMLAAVALVLLDVIYGSRRRFLAAKFLFPGTVVLLLFALFPIGYTLYLSLTTDGPAGGSSYEELLTNPGYREALLRAFVWTLGFSVLSVLTTFALGLALALVLDHERMRGRGLYRALLILPFAFPAFVTILVWKGMLSTRFGIVNRTFGWSIPWLDGTTGSDAIWPYVSILLVNLWLGFPYLLLVTAAALRSIPADLKEAALVEGATAFAAFRRVTFPLLLASVAPLLVAGFVVSFNNFNLIYLLTGGNPPVPGSEIGRTDILLSGAWKLAFDREPGAFGLASAVSVIIFVLVAAVSAAGFRVSHRFEEARR